MTPSVAVTATMMCRLLTIAFFLASSALICTGFAPNLSVRGRAIPSSASVGRCSLPVAPASIPLVSSRLMMNTLDSLTATSYGDSEMVLASSSIILSETEAWVQPLSFVLGPFLTFFSFAMLCRIVLSWYPSASVKEFPFSVVVWPTEPLLRLLRGSIPPAFGVDITPVVWLGFFSFMNEIFLGQQGLLTLLNRG